MKDLLEKINTGNWLKDWLFPRYKFKDEFVHKRHRELIDKHDIQHFAMTNGECSISPSCEECKHFKLGNYVLPTVYNYSGKFSPHPGYVVKPKCRLWGEIC